MATAPVSLNDVPLPFAVHDFVQPEPIVAADGALWFVVYCKARGRSHVLRFRYAEGIPAQDASGDLTNARGSLFVGKDRKLYFIGFHYTDEANRTGLVLKLFQIPDYVAP